MLPPQANQILIQAGKRLSAIALQQPGMHLKSLSLIRSVTITTLSPTKYNLPLLEIRRSLWSALHSYQQHSQAGNRESFIESEFVITLRS